MSKEKSHVQMTRKRREYGGGAVSIKHTVYPIQDA